MGNAIERRGFLKGLLGAAAVTPLLGKYVIDSPSAVTEPRALVVPDRQLLVPTNEPLVITTKMPMKSVRSVDALITSLNVDYGPTDVTGYGDSSRQYVRTMVSASGEVQFVVEDDATLSALMAGWHTHSGRVRMYFESENV